MDDKDVLEQVEELIYDEEYSKAWKLLDRTDQANNEEANWFRVEILLAKGQFEDADDVFKCILSEQGDTTGRLTKYTDYLMNAGLFSEARKVIGLAIDTQPENWRLMLQKADVLFHTGMREEASNVAKSLVTGQSVDFEAVLERAEMYYGWAHNVDDDEEAIVGRHAMKFSPSYLELALADYTEALSHDGDKRLLLRRAEISANLNQYDEAVSDISILLEESSVDDPMYEYVSNLMDEYSQGPEFDRNQIANLLRESLTDSMGVNRNAAEGVVHDVIETAAQRIIAGQDMESAFDDLASEDEDMWQAVSIAQQIYANGSWPESDWVEVSADEFPKSSIRWADSCHKKLEKIGFNHLGDFEDVELTPIIGQRIFVRLMLSPDGKTWAAIYKHSMPWPGILGWVKLMISGKWFVPGVIEFESANESRQFIITNNTGDLDLFDISPGIDKHALKKGSSVEKVLASHKGRLLEFGSRSQTLVEVTDLGGVVEMQDHQRVMKNEYRHSIGFVTDEELIQLLGDRYDDIGGLVRIKLSELADLSVS